MTPILNRDQFGDDFIWGVASSSYQIEGACTAGGKSPSIWDTFSHSPNKIKTGENGDEANDYYHLFPEDHKLMASLGIKNHRLSISWPRILPDGYTVNQAGIDYYLKVFEDCQKNGITPWVTLYHWDLPQSIQNQGGWCKRSILASFEIFVETCTKAFGHLVNNWMIINEPWVIAHLGHLTGLHAPGQKGLQNYLPAIHHLTLAQALGGKIVKGNLPQAKVGTTFSAAWVDPYRPGHSGDETAAHNFDTLLNRLFIEPLLGLGYPDDGPSFLNKLKRFKKPGDDQAMAHDFDFIGIQLYTREKVRHSRWRRPLKLKVVSASERDVERTEMNWEIAPEAIYKILHRYHSYGKIKELMITENGAAFSDRKIEGSISDPKRIAFLQAYLSQALRAKEEGVPLTGYFVWTFTDNFEWAEGYRPRFGLVYVDRKTLERTPKQSALWYKNFLHGNDAVKAIKE